MPINTKNCIILTGLIICSCQHSVIKFPDIGGYSYPNKINNRNIDFLCYPLIDSLSRKDSFETALYGRYVLHAFHEPNLSLRSAEQPIFRLIYESWYEQTIISLTQKKITVKEVKTGLAFPIDDDTSKLTSLEKYHYAILRWNFPLESTTKIRFPSFYDSITKVYPELLDPSYFKYLFEKVKIEEKEAFEYSTTVIPISKQKFIHLIDLINSSGFWTMPHHIRCKYMDTDAASFILEANTPKKYKVVFAIDCSDDRSKFKIACQELVKSAKLDKKIQMARDESAITTDSTLYLIDTNEVIMKDKSL
jgi:hypothetical protein